jgi:toluene monooxygenase system protein A
LDGTRGFRLPWTFATITGAAAGVNPRQAKQAMLKRDDWLDLARKVDWELTYVDERAAFPEVASGSPWLPRREWAGWQEPFRTTYSEYVVGQQRKEASIAAVRDAIGNVEDFARLPAGWGEALKLHAAVLSLAEFAAVIGNLRAARFARDSAWRTAATFGALDELRHTQIPLAIMHELLSADAQFDWTHKLYRTQNWVAIAARHFTHEMLIGSDPIEFAIATNLVLETGFTNLQFVGLAAVAHSVGDRMFEAMVSSIQTDEARHAQIGEAVLRTLVEHDRPRAQALVDKWLWRSWPLFAVMTGFAMDYLTPLEARERSFKEFMEEWIVEQFGRLLARHGLQRPWYWDTFLRSIDYYHHMVYASAYTYRASVWFDFVLPGPDERSWLREKYPSSFPEIDPVWDQVTSRWRQADIGNDLAVHGTAIIGFCELCQMVLCQGTPRHNDANVLEHGGEKYIFCSRPCRALFEREPERYAAHRGVIKRVLAGAAPANLVALLRHFGLSYDTWGKDVHGGDYPWIERGSQP